jgi:hypothetical protein
MNVDIKKTGSHDQARGIEYRYVLRIDLTDFADLAVAHEDIRDGIDFSAGIHQPSISNQ